MFRFHRLYIRCWKSHLSILNSAQYQDACDCLIFLIRKSSQTRNLKMQLPTCSLHKPPKTWTFTTSTYTTSLHFFCTLYRAIEFGRLSQKMVTPFDYLSQCSFQIQIYTSGVVHKRRHQSGRGGGVDVHRWFY